MAQLATVGIVKRGGTFIPALSPAHRTMSRLDRLFAFNDAKNRDWLVDLRAMFCANGLAASRSSLHLLTFAHTRATHLFVPGECGPGTYQRRTRVEGDDTAKIVQDNTTLLVMEKPDAKVNRPNLLISLTVCHDGV